MKKLNFAKKRKRISFYSYLDSWMCLWQSDQPYHKNNDRQQPIISPTRFKCDKIKLTIQNEINLIDAIGKL